MTYFSPGFGLMASSAAYKASNPSLTYGSRLKAFTGGPETALIQGGKATTDE